MVGEYRFTTPSNSFDVIMVRGKTCEHHDFIIVMNVLKPVIMLRLRLIIYYVCTVQLLIYRYTLKWCRWNSNKILDMYSRILDAYLFCIFFIIIMCVHVQCSLHHRIIGNLYSNLKLISIMTHIHWPIFIHEIWNHPRSSNSSRYVIRKPHSEMIYDFYLCLTIGSLFGHCSFETTANYYCFSSDVSS